MATKKFNRGEIVIVKSLLMNNDAPINNDILPNESCVCKLELSSMCLWLLLFVFVFVCLFFQLTSREQCK